MTFGYTCLSVDCDKVLWGGSQTETHFIHVKDACDNQANKVKPIKAM